jgi:uncharacterized protein (TIGR02145 family)
MKTKHSFKFIFLFALFSLIILSSCSKDDSASEPINQNGGEVFRSQVVTINLNNVTLSENEYQGMLGDQNIVLQKSDDNRLLFSVAQTTPLGLIDLIIPTLNNTTIHYEVKNTELSETPDETMAPFFTNLNAVNFINSAQNLELQNSINSFNAVYDNLTLEEKTEMAIMYKANTVLINNILLNDFSSFGRNNASSTGIISSMTLHKTAVLGIAAGAVLFELGVHPGVKALGAVLAGVSTGFAIEYFGQVIDIAAIRFGIMADNLIGTNDRDSQSTFISFQNDVQKSMSLDTKNRKLMASDSDNPKSDIISFFKYHNKFNYIINAINNQITWVNNNVIFANFSLIGLEVMPTTSPNVDNSVNTVDFSKISFSVNHSSLQLVSSTLQSDGQLNMKIKIIGTPNSLPVESFLNYSYTDDLSSFSGKLPIEVNSQVTCGTITDVDGNLYPTVSIGTQCWTQINLNVSKYRNGDIIPHVTDPTQWENLTTGAWCYYENNGVNGVTYGKLYNWFAVNDPRGLAPQGYHIPTDLDWNTLSFFLGGVSVAGGMMKSTSGWNIPNSNPTNSSGFTALPGGMRAEYLSTFTGISDYSVWWSLEENLNQAYNRNLFYNSNSISKNLGPKTVGLSVRCIKD